MERRGCSECRTQLLIAALCVLFGIQLISSNLAPAIASQAVPLLPQQRERAAAGRVALCFFGLVKDIDEDLIRSLSEGIVKPLTAAGFSIDSFLHTYHATTFFNAFNKETDGATFNQSKSLTTLKGLLPNLKVATDFISTPDRFMPLERYLRAGDPWPFHPNESLRFFLRQQFSLLRVTEMWSGSPDLSRKLESGGPVYPPANIREQYDGVIYLRPDLFFLSKLNLDAFDAVVGASTAAAKRQRRGASGEAEHTHPWLGASGVDKKEAALSDDEMQTHTPAPSIPNDDDSAHNAGDMEPSSRGTSLFHIAIPTFEWGGLHDRFAFGGPDVMFFYGVRALALGHFIDVLRQPPHAERYLRKYLCALGAAVHVVPQFTARKRINGVLEDDGARLWRAKYFNKRLQSWAKWHQGETIDRYGRGPRRQCMFASMWSHVPFDAEAKRVTAFRKR